MAKRPGRDEAVAADAEKKKREWIRTAAGLGLPHETIARLVVPPMAVDELEANYGAEMADGVAVAHLNTLAKMHEGIAKGSVGLIIWYTKVHLGWKEKGPSGLTKPNPESEPEEETPTTPEFPTGSQLSGMILGFPRKR